MNEKKISISQAIDTAGLKRSYVAERLGIGYTYLPEYLRNPSKMSIKNAAIISELTGYPLRDLDFGLGDTQKFLQ